MTMTSVAVAPASLGAPPAMLTPKRYHLQPGLQQNSSSPSPIKNYDTLSKAKKSWSVRLGLSRQSYQGKDDTSKGWGTISGGSALSRQMLYGDPWLYGTVRSSRGIHDPRAYLTPPPPPPGAPVLIVCSCPEFLIGTTRKLGNCRKCGGHRLAGVPLGGTCRIATTSSRTRPSLAGILRSSVDDPYDVMRRSRLVEPRSRARSISPHRQTNQRDSRSQSIARSNKDRKAGSAEVAVSRTEWFDTETSPCYEQDNSRKSRPSFAGASSDVWLEETRPEDARNTSGRVVRVAKKPRNWQDPDNAPSRSQENARRKSSEDWKDGVDKTRQVSNGNNNLSGSNDSRKSILECDVNPYLLVKKQMRDEDDLSDDLSDNALEHEHEKSSSSSLFDSSKVKSIERVPNRSAVAAIGGQRIRVFNEPREMSDEEETIGSTSGTVTRIPIPKISPKRPPRRIKESRQTLKSILKRGKADGKRKNVLFNVNNVIFAPEKPPEMSLRNSRRSSRISINPMPKDSNPIMMENVDEPIVPAEQHVPERPKFITIPNIRDPKRTTRVQEPKIIPEVKINPALERTKIEQSTIARRPEVPARNVIKRETVLSNKMIVDAPSSEDTRSLADSTITEVSVDLASLSGKSDKHGNASEINISVDKKARVSSSETSLETIRPEDETELEIEIEELERKVPAIENTDKELILKSGDENGRRACLSRSQSDRASMRPETTAGSVNYLDTMRLSLRRRVTGENGTDATVRKEAESAIPEMDEKIESSTMNFSTPIAQPTKRDDDEEEEEGTKVFSSAVQPEATVDTGKEAEPPPPPRRNEVTRNGENFRRMRPTSWSPPPGKSKHTIRDRASDPGPFEANNRGLVDSSKLVSSVENIFPDGRSVDSINTWKSSSSVESSSRIEIINARPESNVCKITVSPRASPLIHRLRINGNETSSRGVGARRTSILINGDQSTPIAESASRNDNKVTISVGGEDSVCNPTVISVNSARPPKIQSSSENRTLVILENYRSNIVLESASARNEKSNATPNYCRIEDTASRKQDDDSAVSSPDEGVPDVADGTLVLKRRNHQDREGSVKFLVPSDDERASFRKNTESKPQRYREIDSARWSSLSKESLISKLLEDSLRKARENGEILDESSGEAILRILKQSLLKSKDYESSESTIEPEASSYSRSPSVNSDTDFVSTNLFLEENPYEVIKEPIYEEIPDEPPPLPLSPPPSEDYIKDRLYFTDEYKEAYYKKVNAGQFLRSYMSNDTFKKSNNGFKLDDANLESYMSKSPEEFFKNIGNNDDANLTSKFELLNFLMDSKDRAVTIEEDEVDDDEEEEEDDDDDDEDTEGDLEALYEQKETSMGDLSSKSSQISNVSDSSEECNILLTNSPETLKTRTVDIERTDSGVGSESSQASSSRGITRRWRTGNVSSGPASLLCEIPQVISGDTKLCEDCEQRLEPLITDSGVVYAPFVCRKCSKKRAERKEIITEIVETEQKYGRDLQIILEEFHRPMLRAGLLTQEQLSAIFLNVEELLEHNLVLAEKLKDAVAFSQVSGDEDLVTVDVGKIFLESERMLHAFESYCTRQGGASLLLQNLEKEKELLRIFLKVSQMENTVLRRMNLNSFLMVPVQRVTKYPLLLARLLKATPSIRIDVHEARKRLEQARANIELHLEHMNAEAKDVTSTKLWRRISIIQNGRRSNGEQDMVNIKLRKMAVEVLEWAHEEARFVLEGRLLVAQPTDNNWRRGRTVKLAPVTAMLVTNGKPSTEFMDSNDDSLFPRQIGIKEATLLLVKEKIGRYSLLREPLYLDKCIVCCETDLEDYFEIQELSSKETFIFKAEDGARTKRWCRTLQAHAQSLGAWRRRRGALPNIMICGVARS